jgi:hypothetical protein
MAVVGVQLPDAVATELRRTTAELLHRVPFYADGMLNYIVERIHEAGKDEELRGLTLRTGGCVLDMVVKQRWVIDRLGIGNLGHGVALQNSLYRHLKLLSRASVRDCLDDDYVVGDMPRRDRLSNARQYLVAQRVTERDPVGHGYEHGHPVRTLGLFGADAPRAHVDTVAPSRTRGVARFHLLGCSVAVDERRWVLSCAISGWRS